jgi:ABC-type glutathione transport system ATPase component
LRQSDEILVMDAGEIVERGTHDGLMRRNGRYREIFELQRLQGSETTDAGDGGSLRPRAGGGEDVPGGGEEGQ